MKTFLQSIICLLFIFSTNVGEAKVQTCDKSVKVTAFTQVKVEKSYFYTHPSANKKSKSFVVANDFLQVLGESKGTYLCVVYRNYNGYGGKQKYGWLLTHSLYPSRVKLERKDLFGSSEAPEKIEIEFGKTEEPGTILLIGLEGWGGVYHR